MLTINFGQNGKVDEVNGINTRRDYQPKAALKAHNSPLASTI